MTDQENGSQSSKEMHCEIAARPCPSSEEIEEQCRRIGMAGLYIAGEFQRALNWRPLLDIIRLFSVVDLNPQPTTSFTCTNSNIPNLEHQNSSVLSGKLDFHKSTAAPNALVKWFVVPIVFRVLSVNSHMDQTFLKASFRLMPGRRQVPSRVVPCQGINRTPPKHFVSTGFIFSYLFSHLCLIAFSIPCWRLSYRWSSTFLTGNWSLSSPLRAFAHTGV